MERFFLIGCQIDEIELKELLLRRYHTLNFEMEFWEFVEFVNLALETEKKEKAERLYLVLLPTLIQVNKYMTFDQFYEEISGANLDLRPADVILKESEEIEKRLKNGS